MSDTPSEKRFDIIFNIEWLTYEEHFNLLYKTNQNIFSFKVEKLQNVLPRRALTATFIRSHLGTFTKFL